MVAVLLAFVAASPQVDGRIAAIYRCPSPEAESKFFQRLVDDYYFDSVCVEPKPGPLATKLAKGKLKFVDAKTIDTAANLKWRNATIAFASGKISPKQWLADTKNLKATIHFLSSPKKTKDLRTQMSSVPVDPGQSYSGRSVFAELLVLAWPGRVCFTADDIWRTRYLPEAGRHQSWVLAMNDFLGPMMYSRLKSPIITNGQPTIIRADAKPGLLIFRHTLGKRTITFYLNNSFESLKLPKINLDNVSGIDRGLDVDGPKPRLMPTGFLIEDNGA
jgi:hypothetical protein